MASVIISGDTSGAVTITAPAVAGTPTLTLPTTTDTLVGKATTDTLTNKSIVASQLTGTQTIPKATLPTGSVLQVVQATLLGTQAVSGASAWADVTSLSVSITPTSSSSKILVSFVVNCDGENNLYFRIMRGATAIGVGNADGSRQQVSAGNAAIASNVNGTTMMTNQFLDSPATTSSTTYKIQAYCDSSAGSGTYYINYASGDGNNAYSSRCMSSITVMEISA
jgi:hypothetical protein